MLVVFINQTISFDEVENNVYQSVVETELNPLYLKKEALELVSSILRYNYFRRKKNEHNSVTTRLFLGIEMKFNAKKFKRSRM
jgi:hypothetical protein